MANSKMINIGCGDSFHPDWTNLDVLPVDARVLSVDLKHGLPFESSSVSVCYSSHVLEHFDKKSAPNLVSECFRVLQPGGTIRLVLPDLEAIAREYLRILDGLDSTNPSATLEYDWIVMELLDQAVRNYSGGNMAEFLVSLDASDRSYVRSRIGVEAEKIWDSQNITNAGASGWPSISWSRLKRLVTRVRRILAGGMVYLVAGKDAFENFRTGMFRGSGEAHLWMYDRFSLTRLLTESGFVNVAVCSADTSRIPSFNSYSLDVENGKAKKPDSIYIEATKP